MEYTLRQREFESNRALYEGLTQRLRTAGVQAGLESLEIDVVDPAQIPAFPKQQPQSTIIITTVVFSLLGGIVVAFLMESLDTGLRSIAEIESITELPSLAIVPRARRSSVEEAAHLSTAQRNISVLTQPKSQFAEAFRSLRTSLLLSTAGHPPKFILFTSATPSEGKTTAASNLACILAQGDSKVLLLDADLRRPNVHHRFGLNGKVGLTTLLTGTMRIEDAVQRVPEVPNLDILPSGPVPPFPTEMLGSEVMSKLLARCGELYSHVVIDFAPHPLGDRRCHSGSRGRCRGACRPAWEVEQACGAARSRPAASFGRADHRHCVERGRHEFSGVLRILRLLRLLLFQRRYRELGVEEEAWRRIRKDGAMTMRGRQSMVRTHRYERPGLICRLSGLLLALLAVAGSAQAQFNGPALGLSSTVNRKVVPTTDPAILYPVSREILLGQGDVIAVRLYSTVDYSPNVRVALDGTIQLPLIGSVTVDGLSLHQAENLIARRLQDAGMYRDPQVSIQLIDSPNEIVTITGEMHGVFPVAGGKRLYDVLSLAGGLPATASHMVIINRPGIPDPIVVDLGTDPALSNLANVPIFPRDTIVISRVGVVYLLGAFKLQGAIPIQQDSALTLMELTALGGGAGFEGRYEDLRLIRTSGTTRTVVTLDLKKILRGQAPDLRTAGGRYRISSDECL